MANEQNNKNATRRFKTSTRADIGGKRKYNEDKKEASKRKKRYVKKRKILMSLSIIVIAAAVLYLVYKLTFVVTTVDITGSTAYTEEQILAAAGIDKGVNLFSFKSSTVKDGIKKNCPFIKEVETSRSIPNTLHLTVTEVTAAYGAEVYGDRVLLDRDLKVLAVDTGDGEYPEGVIKLLLPDVKKAITGEALEFADEMEGRFVTDILSALGDSSVYSLVTKCDLTDVYSAKMYCPTKKCVLDFGSPEDVSKSLLISEKIMNDDMFSDGKTRRINLKIEGKTGISEDNTVVFD